MNKETIISGLLLLVFGIWISQAHSMPTEEPPTINAVIPCNDWEVIVFNLTKTHEELPVASAKGGIQTDQTNLSGKFITFINPESRSFTVVLKMGEGDGAMACIVAAGDEFGPAVDQESLDMIGKVKT